MPHPDLTPLYATLSKRYRPEDVADCILQTEPALTSTERALLERAAHGALRRSAHGYSSMLATFARPVGACRLADKAAELFAPLRALTDAECDDPESVEAFIRELSPRIGKTVGASSFRNDRLSHAERDENGIDLSRRQYNKRFRLLTRLEDKLVTLARETRKYRFTRVGKSGLATDLSYKTFAADPVTAAFVAYFVARLNLRSEFTISGQTRPFDEIAAMLYRRAAGGASPNWWAMAHVFPGAEVLAHLTDAQRGELVARWFGVLTDVAEMLGEVFRRSHLNLGTMVVKRGDDSTTWNNLAAAWNKARANWIAALYAMGMGDVLDVVCPGKVLRLMAGDVTAWHEIAGDGTHPDTLVWRDLPLPWEVLTGTAVCTRESVKRVCARHSVDPVKNGWTMPRPPARAVPFSPTPELVHGVSVGSPTLAELLRDAGFFSGKPAARDRITATPG